VATFRLEKLLLRQGLRLIAGVDEVGRGALFGPVVAAAVVMPPAWLLKRPPAPVREIDDSKALAPTKRAELASFLAREAPGLGVGMASAAEIDEMNILRATHLAMRRALGNLPVAPDVLLVDGFPIKDVHYRQMGVPGGDRKCRSIAAASIVAKVFRDDLMTALDGVYGGYGLVRNKGYGTREHFRCLREKGPTGLHRRSFNWG
jgi:ribonuclease HII